MNDAAIRNNSPPPSAPQAAPLAPPRPGIASWILGFLPTFLALALLAGIGYWGYRWDWEIPSLARTFARVFGEKKKQEDNEDWCKTHAVAKKECVECNPKLLPAPPKYGWCEKHGVHDCTLEHPDVAQLATVPKIADEDLRQADRALKFSPRKENDPTCQLHPRRIQLASVEAFKRAEIEIDKVGTGRIVEGVTAPGEITYDPTRVARVSARVAGTVRKVLRGIGEKVKPGEVVALVDSPDVGRAKADFLQAAAQLNLRDITLRQYRKAGAALAPARLLEAQTAVQEAKIRLLGAEQALVSLGLPVRPEDYRGLEPEELARRVRQLGLSAGLLKLLSDSGPTANLLPVRSPLGGEVVSRPAVEGEVIDTTKLLLMVADTSRMWLTLNVRQEESRRLARGQKIEFQPDSGGAPEKGAKVSWISPSVDEKTRTVMVRAELDNQDGRLRANTYGTGRIILREEADAVVVPNGAVHWDGHCNVVFVLDKTSAQALKEAEAREKEKKAELPNAREKEDGPKQKEKPVVFHVRCVRVGVRDGNRTEIIAGVLPGERIADENSEVLRGQLLRDTLGGGD